MVLSGLLLGISHEGGGYGVVNQKQTSHHLTVLQLLSALIFLYHKAGGNFIIMTFVT